MPATYRAILLKYEGHKKDVRCMGEWKKQGVMWKLREGGEEFSLSPVFPSSAC